MNLLTKNVLVAAVCTVCAGRVSAEPVLTFEGLQNHEQVDNYYNGGLGSLGSGPGPDYGITFSANALALVRQTPFPNDPSPPTVLLLGDFGLGEGQPLAMTMDVADGFSTGLVYYDINIAAGDRVTTINIYSGLDGMGTLLAQTTLPLQSPSNEVFDGPETLFFPGTAHSVVLTGGNLQLALDNISFASLPEPSGWLTLTIGLATSFLAFSRWRPRAAIRSGPT